MDHKNGHNKDNRIENLRWVCPNCDRQLDTFGAKNKKDLKKGTVLLYGDYNHTKDDVSTAMSNTEEKKSINIYSGFCIDCGKPIDIHAKRCNSCSNIAQRKITRPLKEDLENLLKKYNGNFTSVAKLYNVTDNTIRKWCKNYNLPIHSKDYKIPKQEKETKSLVIYPVDQIDIKTGKVIASFESISEAERTTKIYHITEASDPDNKTRNTVGGYLWRRK